jgi:hypothetical protein
MGSRQIVLVSTAGFSVLNTGIFWREAKTKRLFSQCSRHATPLEAEAFGTGLTVVLYRLCCYRLSILKYQPGSCLAEPKLYVGSRRPGGIVYVYV